MRPFWHLSDVLLTKPENPSASVWIVIEVLTADAPMADPDNPLSVQDQTDEGVTMDDDGTLYVVNEDGGGDADHPQLWVYAPSTAADQPPTAVTLSHEVTSIPDTTSTASRVKVADVSVTDDGIGVNNLSVTGPDAAAFEVDSSGLYVKAGTILSDRTYTVSVGIAPPIINSNVAAVAPTEFLKALMKNGDARADIGVAFGNGH